MKRLRISFFITVLLMALLPARARPQSQVSSDEAQQLRQLVAQMQAQMSKMQAEIDELKGTKAQAQPTQPTTAAAPPAAPAQQEGTIQSTQPPAQGATSGQVGSETASRQQFGEDKVAAARFNNVPLDPKYNGFFRLGNTQTILKIGGYFKSDSIHDFKPAGNTDAFVPSSFPVPQVPGVYNSTISIRPTRLNLDFRILNTSAGDVRFYVEGDFFGTNSTTPRLRHAYAQVANFLVGQSFTNFMDPDGFPDVLFTTPQFTSQPNAPSPDGAIRFREEFERGHFQIAAIFRGIAAFLPNGDTDTVFSWGLNTSLGVKTFGKDNVIFGVAAGHGISRYIHDTSGLGIDAEPVSGIHPHLEATPGFGIDGAYQHFWLKKLRSSAVYSYAAVNNTDLAAGTTYNHATYTGANLIWNPVGSLNVGGEFLYGWKMLQNGKSANDPRLQFSAKYSFVKVDPD